MLSSQLCYLHAELFKKLYAKDNSKDNAKDNAKEIKKQFVEFYNTFLDKGAVSRALDICGIQERVRSGNLKLDSYINFIVSI